MASQQNQQGKKIGPTRALQLKPCEDPESREYRQHKWVAWGDDDRYKRCRRCGAISAQGVSREASQWQFQRMPDRPVRHYHSFEPCRWDSRYERCGCGATRKIPAPVGGAA